MVDYPETRKNCYHCTSSELAWRGGFYCRRTGDKVRKTQKACDLYRQAWYDIKECKCTQCQKALRKFNTGQWVTV